MLVGDLVQSLAERLKFLRESKGLSLRKLAEKVNIHFSTLGSYEQGRRNPDIETLKMLAEFYNVSVDYLLGLVDDPRGIISLFIIAKNIPLQHVAGGVRRETRRNSVEITGQPLFVTNHDQIACLDTTRERQLPVQR